MAIFFDIYNRMTSKKTFSSSAWNVNRPNLQGCDGRNSAFHLEESTIEPWLFRNACQIFRIG
jgi:hypothetical protein